MDAGASGSSTHAAPATPQDATPGTDGKQSEKAAASDGAAKEPTPTTPNAGGKGGKQTPSSSTTTATECKIEYDLEVTELLGSVTTLNCPGTRTSARVIQKMKQDQIRPSTPPPAEREAGKKDDKAALQKTPSAVRGGGASGGNSNSTKSSWSNLERNHFFDALNEFGKDFDAIGNYLNTKLKRKCASDVSFKTKDQVRQHYYQTYHKICKYMKFSDEIKKPAQELYTLINYGEMRRKLQFVTDKHFMKLRALVYHGLITVRCKGKNIRIKTPSCKALRRLNQLDDTLEDIRLPTKIEVVVTPATMEAYGRVQTVAQNPRVRTTVPLHKKLVNFIKAFQYKWRSTDYKLAEAEAKLYPTPSGAAEGSSAATPADERTAATTFEDPEMCFLPMSGVTIHRPLLSITEYLSSVNICLAAYEERMGVKVRGEMISVERNVPNKRQRTESGSDKRSPDMKKSKSLPATDRLEDGVTTTETAEADAAQLKSESSGDELLDELLSDVSIFRETQDKPAVKTKEEAEKLKEESPESVAKAESSAVIVSPGPASATTHNTTGTGTPVSRQKRAANNSAKAAGTARSSLIFKPLLSDDVIRRIRKGWTVSSAADITIGDLYVALGHDTRLELGYYWTTTTMAGSGLDVAKAVELSDGVAPLEAIGGTFAQKQNGMPYNPADCGNPQLLQTLASSSVANRLKHLLLIANLSERIRKRQCSCGHTCERTAAKTRFDRDLATKTFISSKTYRSVGAGGQIVEGNALFRQPIAPLRRAVCNLDPVKQLTTLTRPKMSRQVLVQRLLLPGGGPQQYYDPLDGRKVITKSGSKLEVASSTTAPEEVKQKTPSSTPANFEGAVKACAATNTINTGFTSHATPSAMLASVTCQEKPMSHVSSPSLPDSAFDDISLSNSSLFAGVISPMLRESQSSNSRWLEENLNDFSLTSLLGHLDEINASRDLLDPSSNLSVISESSVDYMHRFQEITAAMRSQDKD